MTTIFGNPRGKWMLGTVAPDGTEQALSGKWVGEKPAYVYPSTAIMMPERRRLGEPNPILVFAAGLIIGWLAKK